jgi:hypothetical protein
MGVNTTAGHSQSNPRVTAKQRSEHILEHEFGACEDKEENGYSATQTTRPHQIGSRIGLHGDAANLTHGRGKGQSGIEDRGSKIEDCVIHLITYEKFLRRNRQDIFHRSSFIVHRSFVIVECHGPGNDK